MPQSAADLQTELLALRARKLAAAGIRSTQFADQMTAFDHPDLDQRIAAIERQLAVSGRGSTTRYAATSKGL